MTLHAVTSAARGDLYLLIVDVTVCKVNLVILHGVVSPEGWRGSASACRASPASPLNTLPYTLHPSPYTLHPTPYTLHPTPYTLRPTVEYEEFVGAPNGGIQRVPAILCTGGLDLIRKEAWPLYRTISGVRLCWELKEPTDEESLGPKCGVLRDEICTASGPQDICVRRIDV